MNIEIRQLELKALILERMQTGRFENVEDALVAALKSSSEESRASSPEESLEQMFLKVRGLFEDGELDFSRDHSLDRPVDLS